MHVWGWGGGVSLAEVSLAKHFGCRVGMLASKDERLALIQQMGIQAIDRRRFPGLDFDEAKWQSDRAFKKRFVHALKVWSDTVRDLTDGANVAIFVDNIGAPVTPATLRALAHRGVVTTTGWKHGMRISLIRANECINHHIHVHTHGCPFHEIAPACAFSEKTGWGPPVDGHVYSFEEIPQLAADYEAERVTTYFPLFQVNPL
jgi:NADPH:quinone reductase-like Zn-dependent oxidoreductase